MNTTTTPFTLRFAADCKPNQVPMIFEFTHSNHSKLRSMQRSLPDDVIAYALKYGTVVYKQGMQYYILGEKDLQHLPAAERKKYMNVVVIISGKSDNIITCYRRKNPYKYIRLKSKQMYKMSA